MLTGEPSLNIFFSLEAATNVNRVWTYLLTVACDQKWVYNRHFRKCYYLNILPSSHGALIKARLNHELCKDMRKDSNALVVESREEQDFVFGMSKWAGEIE